MRSEDHPGGEISRFPAVAKLAKRLGGVVLISGGCHWGQTKRDMALQTGRPVSKEECVGALKTRVLQWKL